MSTFVLVPGACHGGWWYDPLVARLEAEGHTAVAVTPDGLEDAPQLDQLITLDVHLDQVVTAVPDNSAAVLVGHSYAGSLISGAAD